MLFPSIISSCIGLFVDLPLLIIFALPLLLILVFAWACIKHENRPKIFASPMLSCSIAGVAIWVSELQRMDFMHLIYGSPLLIVVAFALFCICFEKDKFIFMSAIILVYVSIISLSSFHIMQAIAANHEYGTREGLFILTAKMQHYSTWLRRYHPSRLSLFIHIIRCIIFYPTRSIRLAIIFSCISSILKINLRRRFLL